MRQLIGYSLEGLRRQGWREVWVTLGTFGDESTAQAARADTALTAELVETRILPYYRVTPPLGLTRAVSHNNSVRETLSL